MKEKNTTEPPQEQDIELGQLRCESRISEEKIEEDNAHDEEEDSNDQFDTFSMVNFQPVAFYFLRREAMPRIWFIKLVSWSYFERISMFVILCNCVTLGLYDPFDPDCLSQKCNILEKVEFSIYLFFVVEMLCKWLAMGVFGKLGYLSENWNRLDCFIVAAGTFELAYDKGKYMTAVRAIRVLRPLRAINRVPSIRILVMLLLDTLPMLGNVLAMCSLIFTIFGIVGVQMWQGLLRSRCVLELPASLNASEYNITSYYEADNAFVCSLPMNSGLKQCTSQWIPPTKHNSRECTLTYNDYLNYSIRSNYTNACVNWNQYYMKCVNMGVNPMYDTISFDNILIAWVAIFQVITLEGWTDIMYYIQDASGMWNFIYFVVLIVIGSYFMTNLCLVVITTQFQETKQRENELMNQSRRKHGASTSTITSSRYGREGCWVEILKYVAHIYRRTKRRLGKKFNLKCSVPGNKRTRVSKKRKRRKKKLVYHHHHHHHHHHYHHHMYCPGNCQYLGGQCPIHDGCFSPTPNASSADFNSNAQPVEAVVTGNTLTVPGLIPANAILQGDGVDGTDYEARADIPGIVPFVSIVAGSACSLRPSTAPNVGDMITKASALVNINGQPGLSDVTAHSFVSAASISSAAAAATASSAATAVMQTACSNAVEQHPDKGVKVDKFEAEYIYEEGEESETDASEEDDLYQQGDPTYYMKLRRACRTSVDSKWFMCIIMGAIFVNTLTMGIEYYGQPQKMTDVLEILNFIFTAIFGIEMIFKLIGLGLYDYIKDLFNLFDGIIVIISIVELFGDSESGISVLRSFRLLRVFKLVRFLPALRRQLLVMIHTMDNVMTFLALLCIFMFTASILGMNLFGGKYTFPDEKGVMKTSRANFDDLFWAFITVFQVLTQEDWNIVMYDGMRATSKWAGLYFVLLMTVGNYILFNLLVAILVEGFASQPDKGESTVSLRPLSSLRSDCQLSHIKCKERQLALQPRPNFHHIDKLRVSISPTPSIMYIEPHMGYDSDYDRPNLHRRSSLPNLLPQNSPYTDATHISAPGTPISCLSPRTARKPNPFNPSKGRAEVFLNSPTPPLEEEKRTEREHEDDKKPTTKAKSSSCCSKRADWSLYIFSPDNKFRQCNITLYTNKWCDRTILLFIILNCVVMAMEGPSVKDGTWERQAIDICMYIFLAIFTLEMMIKVIAMGLWGGQDAYLRSGWNVMDGFLVVVSWIDVIVTATTDSQNSILGVLRVFRALRTLRPLRVISRAPGLKIVVETLISSLKPIGNIVLIAATFFVIFGILGVQLFKGQFHFCEGASDKVVETKAECLANGGMWVNKEYNFDNLAKALLTLFVFSTKDGWVAIMYDGIDAVGIEKQPIQNYARINVIYFIAFLLLAGFVVLNMLVGVVVENFKKCRALIEMEREYDRDKMKEMEEKTRRETEADAAASEHFGKLRRFIHRICTHGYFDLGIAAIIGLNVVCMTLEHFQQPQGLTEFLKNANYVFTGVFILEAALKIYALGIKTYGKDRWNQLDISIVILSIVGIAFEEMTFALPINPTIIRVMRVLRIARVLKLLKTAEGIRKLLDTVAQALPQVGNLGLLFLLMFFIFAALGIELFGKIDCDKFKCEGMDEHAHFKNFGIAMLTLFRISTGDNWNGILKDTINKKVCEGNSEIDCTVLEHVAPIYFAIFVLATQFVLLNVVVAVLMKHLEDAKEESSSSEGRGSSLSSSRKSSKGSEGATVFLKVPPKNSKVSFDGDVSDTERVRFPKQKTAAEINGFQSGSGNLPMVAVNGHDYNSCDKSDSEFSTTSPLPRIQDKEKQNSAGMLSQSTPSLRPVFKDKRRTSSAKAKLRKDMETSSSSSLARPSPVLGRRTKSHNGDHPEESSRPVLQFSSMNATTSDTEMSPDRERQMSPRAPIYKMSEDSDLYDSALEGDNGDQMSGSAFRMFSPPRPRPSLKSTTSNSSTSSCDDEQTAPPLPPVSTIHPQLRGTETAWGTPRSQRKFKQPSKERPCSSKSVPTPAGNKAARAKESPRPSTGKKPEGKGYRIQSYV